MVDLGIDVGFSYKGDGPDIGTYEGKNCRKVDKLYDDDFVDFKDFCVFAGNWLEYGEMPPGESEGNFNDDHYIDEKDLEHIPPCWLQESY